MTARAKEPIGSPAPGEVMHRKSGEDYWSEWPDYLVRMRLSSMYEDKGGIHGELVVYVDLPGSPSPAEWTQINLSSSQTRATTANRLREQWDGAVPPPFREMLTEAAIWTCEQFREGEPLQRIGGNHPIEIGRFALVPILPEGQTTILYGDGASCKSIIGAAIGLSVQEHKGYLPGTQIGPVVPIGPALYLDYETNRAEQHARIKRIAAGFGAVDHREMLYRQCFQPLHKEAVAIRRFIDDHQVSIVIVDSIGAAMGGDPNEAGDAIRTMTALRALGVTVLCIDHVTKTDDQGKPFGSAYKYNYARSAWHAKKVQEQDSDTVQVALIHRKSNNGRLVSPLGLSVKFDGDEGAITISRLDIRDVEGLAETVSMPNRIRHALAHGPLSYEGIVSAIQAVDAKVEKNTIYNTWKRLRDRRELVPVGNLWGLAYSG